MAESDKQIIRALANQCLLKGGPAVLQARNLRRQFDNLFEYYADDCLPEAQMRKGKAVANQNDKAESLASAAQFTLYPNPATSQVTLEYSGLSESTIFEVYSIMGILVNRLDLTDKQGRLSIQTENWPSGVYICKLVSGTQIIGSSKLIITQK